MGQCANNKLRNEQRIKNRLCLIDLEQTQKHEFTSRQVYERNANFAKRGNEQRDLSDWTNSYLSFNEQPKHRQQQSSPQLTDNKPKFAFLQTARYHSSLLPYNGFKNRQLQLSPIKVKFNAQVLSDNLKYCHQNYVSRLRGGTFKTYLKSIALEHNQRQGEKESRRQLLMHLQSPVISPKKPRQERTSGILSLMKKRESIRIRCTLKNPQDLTATKLW